MFGFDQSACEMQAVGKHDVQLRKFICKLLSSAAKKCWRVENS